MDTEVMVKTAIYICLLNGILPCLLPEKKFGADAEQKLRNLSLKS